MSNRALWIALGAVAVVLLGAGSCLCALGGGFVWVVAEADQVEADDARAQSEGFAAGPGSTGDQCVDAAIARRLACGVSFDPNCAGQAVAFVTACLQSSPAVDPALCAGVPAGDDFYDSVEWAGRVCLARGYGPGSACEDVPPGIAAYCRSR